MEWGAKSEKLASIIYGFYRILLFWKGLQFSTLSLQRAENQMSIFGFDEIGTIAQSFRRVIAPIRRRSL
jgi:hypothetical protein